MGAFHLMVLVNFGNVLSHFDDSISNVMELCSIDLPDFWEAKEDDFPSREFDHHLDTNRRLHFASLVMRNMINIWWSSDYIRRLRCRTNVFAILLIGFCLTYVCYFFCNFSTVLVTALFKWSNLFKLKFSVSKFTQAMISFIFDNTQIYCDSKNGRWQIILDLTVEPNCCNRAFLPAIRTALRPLYWV